VSRRNRKPPKRPRIVVGPRLPRKQFVLLEDLMVLKTEQDGTEVWDITADTARRWDIGPDEEFP
jgi:hypothetical protein